MLDFIIVSHFHYAPALEGAVNMRAVDLKRYARQRYIVYRGHHPLRSLQRLASCRHTYNPQNLSHNLFKGKGQNNSPPEDIAMTSTRRPRLGAQVHHSGFFRQATPRRLLARTEPFLEKLKYVLIRQQATVVGLDADSFFCREPISPNELKGTWKNMNYCLGMFTPGAGVCILLLCNLGVHLKLLQFHFWHFFMEPTFDILV